MPAEVANRAGPIVACGEPIGLTPGERASLRLRLHTMPSQLLDTPAEPSAKAALPNKSEKSDSSARSERPGVAEGAEPGQAVGGPAAAAESGREGGGREGGGKAEGGKRKDFSKESREERERRGGPERDGGGVAKAAATRGGAATVGRQARKSRRGRERGKRRGK